MDQSSDGPTVFDINKPHTYGPTPSARPVITGHQPTMPDPLVIPSQDTGSSESKINVKVDEDKLNSGVDSDSLAESLFSVKKPDTNKDPSGPPAIMEGEPQLSPPFKSDGNKKSAAQRAPYMPVSDLTGISTSSAKPFSDISDGQVTTSPKPSVFGQESTPDKKPKKDKHRKSTAKLWLGIVVVVVVLAGVYAAIDKGLILSSVNLPFHIFKKTEPVQSNTAPSTSDTTIPTGFTATKLLESNISFAYPTAWGAPTAAADLGFTTRTSKAKPDMSYAFLLNFPNNKDIQIAITSAKYLPLARATLYYDFLQWCTGSADGKYYFGILAFSTANGVDSPTTVVCNQGPLSNAVKLNADTIVQTNIKNADGGVLGDIYTKNLTDKSYAVARVKDVTMKNGDQIKTLLSTMKPLQ